MYIKLSQESVLTRFKLFIADTNLQNNIDFCILLYRPDISTPFIPRKRDASFRGYYTMYTRPKLLRRAH